MSDGCGTDTNRFKVLYFGDTNKRALLEMSEWGGAECEWYTTSEEDEALELLMAENPKLVLVDYDQKGFNPLAFLDRLLVHKNGGIVMGVTENSPLDVVIQSIKMGVRDVINVREDPTKLYREMSKIIDYEAKFEKGEVLHQSRKEKYAFHNIVGQSSQMERIFQMISKICERRWVTVLVLGETGTGKELIARAIHYRSYEHYHPFVEINCNTLPENLLESELFGHEKGAFTDAKTQKKGLFELAHSGTLFMDEIGEVSLAVQLKLLKALEEKKIRRLGGTKDIYVSSRIIAATNTDLQEAIRCDRFRKDLYYRLNVVSIVLPPLRDRGDDVVLLAWKFLNDFVEEYNSSIHNFSPDALELLKQYHWPGNVRELKHTIERIVLLNDGDHVERHHLEEAFESDIPRRMSGRAESEDLLHLPPCGMSLEEGEKWLIGAMLEREGWNKSRACEILKISRPRLDRKIEKYALFPSWQVDQAVPMNN